jgi:ABC-type glycerol-3-phosphate transport system substrate-binding protein
MIRSRKRLARRVTTAVALIALATGSAGCSGLTSAYTPDPHVITYLTWEDTTTNAAFDKAFDAYSHGEYRVKRIDAPSAEYNQKITSLSIAERLPDFFWCNTGMADAMGSQGLLYNWADYAKRKADNPLDTSKFASDTLSAYYAAPDKLYGIPSLTNTYGIYYNASFFQKAGLPIPTTTWSWDQLFTDIKALRGVNGQKYGLTADAPSGFYSLQGINLESVGSGGAPLTTKPVNPTKLTADAQYMASVQKFSDLLTGGYITPTSSSSSAASNSVAAFSSGKVGAMYGGQWLAVSFLQSASMKPSDWGYAPLPTGPSKRVQPVDPQGVCSPKNIAHPDEVWRAIAFLQKDALPQVLAKAPVAPPAFEPSTGPYYNALIKAGTPTTAAAVKYELETKEKLLTAYVGSFSTRMNDVTASDWVQLLNGEPPLEKGLPAVIAKLNAVIRTNTTY